jgi:hypothetical protein
MKQLHTFLLVLLPLSILMLIGCKHNPEDIIIPAGPDPDPAGIPCNPDTVYFQNDILPLFLSSCALSGCHDAQTAQDGVNLTSFQDAMNSGEIKPFKPWDSDLYEVLIEDDSDKRMPPPPASPLTQDQIAMIYTWIAQGALNNYCDEDDCDSVNVTFAQTVWPIIQNNCLGCHNDNLPNGGINLNGYNNVIVAGSVPPGSYGSLEGVVTWASGNMPMPQTGSKLPDCSIAQIKKWIADGMPDN